MINTTEIEKRYHKIRPYIQRTPLEYSEELSRTSGANVYLKMEQKQTTGSFKIRGVLSKVLGLNTDEYSKKFVAASTGNHAAAFGYVSKKMGFEGVLFLPENINQSKLASLQEYQVEKIFYGKHSVETEARASSYASEINGVLIHPYNDLEIIKGQGTIGVEIIEQLPSVDVVLVPVGGGGLASGLCAYFRDRGDTRVIGCQPQNACEMYQSIQANKIVPPSILTTIADASAGGIEEGAMTFNICKDYLAGFEIIQEDAIRRALSFMLKHHEVIIEPTSALPVAALMNTDKYKEQDVVIVLTGKKINESLLKEISNEHTSRNS